MRPIPKKLLIHTVVAVKYGAPDMWGKETETERTPITFVRVEPSSALRLSKENQQVQLSAVLFYDCRNSVPQNYDFSHADKIEIDGQAYNIVNVDQLYDDAKLHHLEVGLCL